MVLDSIMNEIKKFCKYDDTCLFMILILIGFLLCMFLNRTEGFLDYGSLEEIDEVRHNYGGNDKDIGKKPEKLGVELRNNKPLNGYGPLEKKVDLARKGKQYQPTNINQDGNIHISQVGLPAGYDWGGHGGYYFLDGSPSSFGKDRPLMPNNNLVDKPSPTVTKGPQPEINNSVVQSSDNELELVLFYAPWCGHSKRMLNDYDFVIESYNGKEMNNVRLSIKKIDMESNKNAAKEYSVEVKGFPTLYTFTNVNGKKVGQIFNSRKKDEIISELEKRTSSIN